MKWYALFVAFFITPILFSQSNTKKTTRAEYIEKYKDDAIEEMNRMGIPASITLAQGILESSDGNSKLAREANNHFGIKCHSDWDGMTFIQDDDKKNECFRKYKNVLDSYKDHSDFLKRRRYAALFELKITDYKGWAKGLKEAGYATNPKYPQLLIKIIEDNNLAQFDEGKLKKTKKEKKPKEQLLSKRKGLHEVKLHKNNIKYIIVKPEDSFQSIADEFEMGLWQLYKYNDWSKDKELYDDGILFLQPKRRKGKEKTHLVKSGESMWDISQEHGIKLKFLYKRNNMEEGSQPGNGDELVLQGRKK